MIIDFNNLSKDQNIIFDKIFNEIKPEYIKLIDDLYSRSDKSIYFLLSSITSRDLYLNETLIKLTQLKFIKHCLLRGNVKKIIIYDHLLKKIVYNLIQSHNCDTKLLYVYGYTSNLIHLLKTVFRIVKNIRTVLSFISAKDNKRLNVIRGMKSIVLINTYFIPSMFVNNEFQDRYYQKLFEFSKNKEKIFFNPTCFLGGQLTKALKISETCSEKFIFSFDVLKITDYFHALVSSFFIFNINFKSVFFHDMDICEIINATAKKNFFEQSLFQPMLSYLFVMRLKELNVDVNLFIDWFENQQTNRGFNIGKSKYYSGTKSIGYQGWIVSDNYYYFHQPTEFEKKIGSVPDKIAVIGTGLIKTVSKYTNTDVIAAPAFRYQHIYQNKMKGSDNMILISLPVSLNIAIYILEFCSKTILNDFAGNVVVNYHPTLNSDPLKKITEYTFTSKPFSELINNCGILISNISSVCVESLAFNVPVIIVQGGSSINQNPIPNDIDKNIWDECYNQKEFDKAFHRLYLEKNKEEQINASKIIKKKYFEPVNAFSVNKFLLNND